MSVIVKCGGGENVTPEVTAQTPIIVEIAEKFGVEITTPTGTKKQILQGNNANLQSIKTNAKKEGLYVWKKYALPNRLPDGYTELEFIESNGTQYIDTGYVATENTEVQADLQYTSTADYQMNGAMIRGSTQRFYMAFTVSGWHFGCKTDYISYGTPDTNRHIFSLNGNGVCKVDDTKYTIRLDGLLPNISFHIGHGNGMNYYANEKIYGVKFYESGNLVRDYIPCKNTSGVIGLYDLINNVFYDNSGTGDFVSGKETRIFLDYVVSDDSSAYPNGGEQGGYWYEKVVEGVDLLAATGCTKVAVDKFTFTKHTPVNQAISHSLGERPKFAMIIANQKPTGARTYAVYTLVSALNSNSDNGGVGVFLYFNSSLASSTFSLQCYHSVSNILVNRMDHFYEAGIEYTLITMA